MARRRARKKVFIRRKGVLSKTRPARAAVADKPDESDEGDYGFISGDRATDFVKTELDSDFVSDNEIAVSDEVFAEFEDLFGSNQELLTQGKRTADSLGKLQNEINKL